MSKPTLDKTPAGDDAPARKAAKPGQLRTFATRHPRTGRRLNGVGIVLEAGDGTVTLAPLPPDRLRLDIDDLVD